MDYANRNVSRVIRSKISARKTYDRLSRWYDLLSGSEDWFNTQGIHMVGVHAGDMVLEIGFGTGKTLLKMAQNTGEKGRIVGLDLSWGMIQVAREKAVAAGSENQISFSLGDGAVLPFGVSAFDVVFLGFTLELFDTPEIPRVLSDCLRVLRPEGRLGIVSLISSDHYYPIVSVYEWVHRNFPTAADCRPIPAREYLVQAGFILRDCLRKPMWGMPVEMLVGIKPSPGPEISGRAASLKAFAH